LLIQLAAHFAQLGEEQRLMAMTELMTFKRKPNENIDALLSRYTTLRFRANQGQVGFTMNWVAYSWLLLKAIEPSPGQLMMLLHPYQGRWPNAEAGSQLLSISLRRMGHILENTHGNIAQALRAPPRQCFLGANGGPPPGYPTQVYPAVLDGQPSQRSSPVQSDPWQQFGSDPWATSRSSEQSWRGNNGGTPSTPQTPPRPPNPWRQPPRHPTTPVGQ